MVTLESGRVKPEDSATIKLVLTAMNQIENNKYSILINKTSETVQTLYNNITERGNLMSYLVPPAVGAQTDSIHFVPMFQELMDQENKQIELPALLSFIAGAPEIKIPPKSIGSIQHSNFEKIVQELRKDIQQLHEENAALRQNREVYKLKFKELGKHKSFKEFVQQHHPSLASLLASNNRLSLTGGMLPVVIQHEL